MCILLLLVTYVYHGPKIVNNPKYMHLTPIFWPTRATYVRQSHLVGYRMLKFVLRYPIAVIYRQPAPSVGSKNTWRRSFIQYLHFFLNSKNSEIIYGHEKPLHNVRFVTAL